MFDCSPIDIVKNGYRALRIIVIVVYMCIILVNICTIFQIMCPVRVLGYVHRVASPFAVATVSYTRRSVKCGRRCAERVRRS